MSILGMMGATPRLKGIMSVSEERGKWVKGRLAADSTVALEVSFEMGEFPDIRFPDTFITYIGAWRSKKTLFEFSLGQLVVVPDPDDYTRLIAPVVLALRGYRPMNVAEAMNAASRSR